MSNLEICRFDLHTSANPIDGYLRFESRSPNTSILPVVVPLAHTSRAEGKDSEPAAVAGQTSPSAEPPSHTNYPYAPANNHSAESPTPRPTAPRSPRA